MYDPTSNAVNGSGSLFTITGAPPMAFAGGDVYNQSPLSAQNILDWIKSNPLLFLVVVLAIATVLKRK